MVIVLLSYNNLLLLFLNRYLLNQALRPFSYTFTCNVEILILQIIDFLFLFFMWQAINFRCSVSPQWEKAPSERNTLGYTLLMFICFSPSQMLVASQMWPMWKVCRRSPSAPWRNMSGASIPTSQHGLGSCYSACLPSAQSLPRS